MKLYIQAHAKSRKKLISTLDAYDELIVEHLAKCAMYCNSLPGDKYNHWIEDELATWLSDVNDSVCKQNNGKLKKKQYAEGLFGGLGNSEVDARINLRLLQEHNKKAKDPYPYVEIDEAMISRMHIISEQVIQKFVPILASRNTIDKDDIAFMLHRIIDPVCLHS
jgi:hypothetical protein